ncbi:MAG: hypothetical protein ACREUU_16880 [Gammaproteobacteria bacterium]
MTSRAGVLVTFFAVMIGTFGSAAVAQKAVSRAPTAADWAALAKLPDFTGVWEIGGGGGGGRGRSAGPSLRPEAEARRKELLASAPEDSQTANCVPPGMPGIMGQPYPMELLLTPGKVTIVIEAYMQARHIYTDGRSLPNDPGEDFHGTSIGRWEGDTLVVETVGFSPLTQIERGVPHSGKMRIVERFRLTDPDTMSIETTITDTGVLTSPYTTNRTLRRHRDWTIAEYICQENNRNFVDDKGKAGVNLNNPGGLSPKK